jgi:hypothetical protein
MGVVAGYLLWSGRLASGPQVVAVIERVVGHQMGMAGRSLVAVVDSMPPKAAAR